MTRDDIKLIHDQLVQKGRPSSTIELVKEVRERTGADLVTAKTLVDAFLSGTDIPDSMTRSDLETILSGAYSESTVSGRTEVLTMIKLVRDRSGLGLKESKDAVDGYLRKRNPEALQSGGVLGFLRKLLG